MPAQNYLSLNKTAISIKMYLLQEKDEDGHCKWSDHVCNGVGIGIIGQWNTFKK